MVGIAIQRNRVVPHAMQSAGSTASLWFGGHATLIRLTLRAGGSMDTLVWLCRLRYHHIQRSDRHLRPNRHNPQAPL
jgi:hypothetical protein